MVFRMQVSLHVYYTKCNLRNLSKNRFKIRRLNFIAYDLSNKIFIDGHI